VNNRIEVFNPAGAYLYQWGGLPVGALNGQFNSPIQVAVDYWGDVYVVDYNNARVQKFTYDGNYLTQWGGSGSGNGQFNFPYGIAVHSNSGGTTVYVADTNGNRIEAFDEEGVYLFQWGGPAPGTGNGQFTGNNSLAADEQGNVYAADGGFHVQKFTPTGTFLAKWGTFGSSNKQFNSPAGVAVDPYGFVYVADSFLNRIQVFAPY
jgi:DNA-binding beta-propeller fold protein YncE